MDEFEAPAWEDIIDSEAEILVLIAALVKRLEQLRQKRSRRKPHAQDGIGPAIYQLPLAR